MKKITSLLLFFLGCCPLFASVNPPKLIVQLVVDQLRGDLVQQYHNQFGPNGFNYLLAHGINYQNAHHPHAHTVTCVGHATVATGSYPSLHGIVANDWYDRKTGKVTYCVEDLQSTILPTNRYKKELPGRSPRNLLASTLSDEIVLAQKGRAFGVSLKDRSAITLAGHAGKAFWFDKENGGFVTSKHYYATSYPQWVNEWNHHYQPSNETWVLMAPIETYSYKNAPQFNNRFPGFGKTFPHQLGDAGSNEYYKYLSMTPFADELTADFAIKLLKAEKLGRQAGKTDYLAISFSVVDAVGHQFGPNSLESEDSLRRLDQTLAKLFGEIDEQVGLKNTLIVLTADHGVTDSSVYLDQKGIEASKAVDLPKIQQVMEQALDKKFKLPKEAIQTIELPYVYLDHSIINEKQLSVNEVTQYLTGILRQQPGIFQAYSLPLSQTETDWLSAKVDKMAFPNRTGDIYLVPPPYQALEEHEQMKVSHGTPWRYDSYVPLLFANPDFKAQRVSRPAHTTDIAPTLSAILAIKAPSAAAGEPLAEVMRQYE